MTFADEVEPEILEPWLRAHIDDTPDQYPLAKVLRKMGMVYLSAWYPWKISQDEKKEIEKNEEKQRRKEAGGRVFDEEFTWGIFYNMGDGTEDETANRKLKSRFPG